MSLFIRFDQRSTKGEIHCADALAFLRTLDTESADLIFLDPPFNLGKRHIKEDPRDDRRPVADYSAWLAQILEESIRVMALGSSLYLYHLPIWAIRFGAQLDRKLTFRHWIAVSMKNGFVRGRSLYPAHYGLLYFTKGEPAVFNRPKLAPTRCRVCHSTIKDYGGYKAIIDEKGVNLSDVWDDLSPVRHRTTKEREQNQLPLTLTDRVIAISGSPGRLLVDPFAGSGSAIISAVNAGMAFKACDIVEDNCRLIKQRLERHHSDQTEKAQV